MSSDIKVLVSHIEELGAAALAEVEQCDALEALEHLRVRYLGKKGEFSQFGRHVKDVAPEDRPQVGQATNRVKQAFTDALETRRAECERKAGSEKIAVEKLDITLPGRPLIQGRLHPVSRILREIEDIFISMGFEIALGPDIEDEFHNFEALNIPEDHPARDMHDTFYMQGGGVLRTHTSPVQIRTMRKRKPPLAVIAPGKVYRCDADVTHSPMFHQVEGLLVDENIRFSDLKGVLVKFLRRLLGPDVQYRFRPSYFPFTEPSAEVDILWKIEGREPQWMEVLGSGMVHPKVLESGGYDPAKLTGFAFGLGADRFAMLKYGIPSLRLLFENDLRFLRQF